MTGRHYHDHLVGIARQRLGRLNADILLSDAGRNAETHRKVLGRKLGGEVREYQRDDQRLLAVVMEGDAPVWIGAEFEIPKRLPETVQAVAIGRRLGDIVSGTGADDHIVQAIGPGTKGDRLRIETTLVNARSIALPLRHRLAGPFRRALRISIEEWHTFSDKSMQREPDAKDLRDQLWLLIPVSLCLAMCLTGSAGFGFVAVMTTENRGETIGGSVCLAVCACMFAWLASALFAGLRVDIGRWRRNRNGA